MTSEEKQLPKGWIVAPLAQTIQPRGEKVSPSNHPEARFIGMDHVESHSMRILGTIPASAMKSSTARFDNGDVLYGRLRPYLNKVAQPNFDGLASAEFIVFPDTQLIRSCFLKHRLNAADFVSFASHLNEGDRPRVSFDQIGKFEILIPPPLEQRRIVAKIEELFSELAKGVESLETARAQLKIYRQAVLKHAFEGKLTAKWREENKDKLEKLEQLLARIKQEREARYERQLQEWKAAVKEWEESGKSGKKPSNPRLLSLPEPLTDMERSVLPEISGLWRWVKVGDLFSVYVGATPSRKNQRYWNGEINWISSGEVCFATINRTGETITQEGLANTSTEVHPIGTVMLGMIGEGKTRGQAAITNIEACHNQNTAAIRVSESDIQPEYVYYYLLYRYEHTRRIGSGNNQKALNKERVSNLPIPLSSLDEQAVLVQELEKHLSVIAQIDSEISSQLASANSLRQSILKKAFAGQLVAQNQHDEPATVLLARIKAGKEQVSKSVETTRKNRKKRIPA